MEQIHEIFADVLGQGATPQQRTVPHTLFAVEAPPPLPILLSFDGRDSLSDFGQEGLEAWQCCVRASVESCQGTEIPSGHQSSDQPRSDKGHVLKGTPCALRVAPMIRHA
eukprot:4563775-Amphidinium_carterae.1